MAAKKVKRTISFYNSYLISVISISLTLFLLGLILIMRFLGNELPSNFVENFPIPVVLIEDLQEERIHSLQDEIERQPCVKSTKLISKEQVFLDMQNKLGVNPVEFLGFNPFHAEINVKLKSEYAHPDSLLLIEKQLTSLSSVIEIPFKDYFKQIQDFYQTIRRIGLVLSILVFVMIAISFVLINNTVRLLIYSKRFLIYTMRLVGATSSFIRKPFIRNNIISGIISALIAIFLLAGLLYYIKKEFDFNEDIIKSETLFLIYLILLTSGIIFSVLATYFAINKYLRISHRKLYYV